MGSTTPGLGGSGSTKTMTHLKYIPPSVSRARKRNSGIFVNHDRDGRLSPRSVHLSHNIRRKLFSLCGAAGRIGPGQNALENPPPMSILTGWIPGPETTRTPRGT